MEANVKRNVNPPMKEECYGYGIWLDKKEEGMYDYHFEGCDPAISFYSSYDKKQDSLITLVSNFECNVWKVFRDIKGLIK